MTTLTIVQPDPAPPVGLFETAPIIEPTPGTQLVSTLQWNNLLTILTGASAAGEKISSDALLFEGDIDALGFGIDNFGFLQSDSLLTALSGQLRLARVDAITWRNTADSADIRLEVNSSDQLVFNGVVISLNTHDLLSATHPDTVASAPVRGGLPVAQDSLGGDAWVQLALGTTGQFLRSDGTDLLYALITESDLPAGVVLIDSVDTLTNKTMTDISNLIHSRQVDIRVRNTSGATLVKGDIVTEDTWNVGIDAPNVILADADNPTAAIGIVEEDILNNQTGLVVETGILRDFDTSAWSVNDTLYLNTGGVSGSTLTNVKPIGTANIQKVGIVARSNIANGVILVFVVGRFNDLPNLPLDNLWFGDSNGVPQATTAGNAGLVTAVIQNTPTDVTLLDAPDADGTVNIKSFGATQGIEVALQTASSFSLGVTIPDGQILIGDAFNDGEPKTISGDILINNLGVATIPANTIDFTQISDVGPQAIIGRNEVGGGDLQILTNAEVTSMLDTFTNLLQGLVPASGGTTTFLRADGTWVDISTIGPHDIWIDAGAFNPVSTAAIDTRIIGTGDHRKAVEYFPFATGVNQIITKKIKLPRNYDGGTITAVINWITETEGSGNVRWNIAAVAASDGDDLSAAGLNYGTAQVVTDTQTTVNQSQDAPRFPNVTIANTPAPGDTIYIRIARLGADVLDTFDQEAQLLGVYLEMSIDGPVAI